MIKAANQHQISSIFNNEVSKVYTIPKYQREYKWGQRNWDDLFNDLTENDEGYFLGSFICVNNGSSMDAVTNLELIDGQQRFTSISLLMLALYSKLAELNKDNPFEDEEKNSLINLKNQLVNKKQSKSGIKKVSSYTAKLVLQNQNFNNEDYQSLLCETEVISEHVAKTKNRGLRRVEKAYRHFGSLISSYIQDKQKEDPSCQVVDLLFDLKDRINNAVLVGIEVDSHSEAYMLFESLNHRGEPLSAIDLIKNILIAEASKSDEEDNSYSKWKEVLSNIGDDYSVQERFFRQYYNAFRKDLNAPWSDSGSSKKYYLGLLATRSSMLEIYETLIKNNFQSFLENLLNKSSLYAEIIAKEPTSKCYYKSLLDLQRIQGAPSYLLLLYIFSKRDFLKIDDELISEVVDFLTKFFVRRNITDFPNTRNLDKIFMDIIDKISSLQGKAVIEAIKSALIQESASDQLFNEKLRGPLYEDNDTATRYILCKIEETNNKTLESYTDLWARDSSQNKYIWTIEHIFPEGENIPEAWVKMIANGDASLAKNIQLECVHTLGNLTITGYNSSLSNFDFEKKKNRQNKEKHEIGYLNGLFLNNSLKDEISWTKDKIQNRTNTLVDIAIKLFSLK